MPTLTKTGTRSERVAPSPTDSSTTCRRACVEGIGIVICGVPPHAGGDASSRCQHHSVIGSPSGSKDRDPSSRTWNGAPADHGYPPTGRVRGGSGTATGATFVSTTLASDALRPPSGSLTSTANQEAVDTTSARTSPGSSSATSTCDAACSSSISLPSRSTRAKR